MADDIVQVMANTRADATTLQEVVNGDENTQVTSRLGESYPSVQKAIKLMTQSGLSFTAFETKSLMTASSLANGSYAIVTNDTTTNNGLHIKKSGSWSKVSYDIDERQKTYTDVVANTALVSAKTYADGKKTDAVNESKFYTDNQSTATLNAAKTDATNKAESVRLSAIASAATDATTKANTALASAKTYADGVGVAAVSQLKTYTDGKKTAAVSESKFYADNQDTVTLNAAKLDATNKAESVRLSSIATSSTDATTKANAALASSKTYSDGVGASALSQSKTYTDTAKASAISTALADATAKANTALASAKTYTDTKAGEALTKANEAADMADAVDLTIKSITSSETDRVGDAPELFSDVIKAEPNPIALGAELYISQIPTIGKVLTVKNKSGYVATRKAVPVYSGHSYSLSASLLRVVNPTDPLNDTVEVGVEWLNQAKQSISHQVISSLTLDSADGVTVIDEPIFPTAASAYVRAWFRIYGSDSETALIYLSANDITDAKKVTADITQSASTTLASAKTYTDTAQAAAISAASTDAQTKADAAREASNKYSSTSFIKKNEADTDLLLAFTDADGNLTDLQIDSDGQFPDAVLANWHERLDIPEAINTAALDATAKANAASEASNKYSSASFIKKNEANTDLLFAFTDSDGNLTELQIDSDGQFPDAVLANWRERLDIPDSVEVVEAYAPNHDDYLLPDMTNTVLPINQSDYHYKGGEFLPVMPNLDQVVYVGSSSAFRSKDSLALKFQALNPNVDVFGFTQGGAVIEHTNMLIGDQPMPLTFENNTINGTGDSNVTYTLGTMAGFFDNNILTGWVSGVYGRLMHHPTNSGKYIFRRLEAGADVVLMGAEPIIPENGHKYRNAMQILWIGKNNMQSGFPGSSADPVATLIDNTRSIIDFSASLIKRTIVMTHYINKDTPAISDERTRITRVNHLYKLHFKDAVFDVNPILTGAQIFTDLGITRTATDIQQQAIGNVPPSLHADSAHLTTAASDYLLDKLIAFIATKNWF